jgi:hypothetical protein
MVRYFYVWTPLVIVGTVFFLSLPWLGLIALMIVSLVALAALALAIVFVPYMLSRAISRVTLLWAADTHTNAVLVRDDSTSDQFELVAAPAAPASERSTRLPGSG